MEEPFGRISRMLRQYSGGREDGDIAEYRATGPRQMGQAEARDAGVRIVVAPALHAVREPCPDSIASSQMEHRRQEMSRLHPGLPDRNLFPRTGRPDVSGWPGWVWWQDPSR